MAALKYIPGKVKSLWREGSAWKLNWDDSTIDIGFRRQGEEEDETHPRTLGLCDAKALVQVHVYFNISKCEKNID